MLLAALGVVFGDIGTSPLYAFKEAFHGEHAIPLSRENVFAVLSLMFWAVTIVVSLKYVVLMLRFDNRGEGGVLALLSYGLRLTRDRPRLTWTLGALGAFAAALFYGDAVITPAISVLSAVEGLAVAAPGHENWVLPIACGVLIALFAVQRHGTASVGRVFGPVMVIWFTVLAALGLASIAQSPEIVVAINPMHAVRLATERPGLALLALGSVFLCVTGAEALYADLGHFGRKPIRRAWFAFVFPALMLNYLGQGALVLRDPTAAKNPFYLLAPDVLVLPLVLLATVATVIASQAVISGAFSVTQQASRLNLLPRLRVLHTSDESQGQIYIPLVNWLLLAIVLLLVVGFGSSSNLAAAYGVAVNGDLIISTIILAIVVLLLPGRSNPVLLFVLAVFLVVESAFLVANLSKVLEGGWFPLVLAVLVFTVLTTWRRGTELMRARKMARPQGRAQETEYALGRAARVPGAAVFFSSAPRGFPTAFLHNLKHNHVVHETLVFVTVEFHDVPRVPDEDRIELLRSANGIWQLVARFGFREEADLGRVLRLVRKRGLELDPNLTSFFTSKPTIVSQSRRGLFGWRRSLFGWMLQNSTSVADYFGLPPNRVVEMGTQIAI